MPTPCDNIEGKDMLEENEKIINADMLEKSDVIINLDIEEKINQVIATRPNKIVLSSTKAQEYKKAIIRRIYNNDNEIYQIERFTTTQAFHENMRIEDLKSVLLNEIGVNFYQLNSFSENEEIDIKISKKGKILFNRRSTNQNNITNIQMTHNKKKKYILEEGMIIPPLIDLGVLSKEGKIINSKYDKFKQINRFIEMIDDIIKDYKGQEIRIIDFGCGKSYLTFVLYYYLVEVKKINAKITGLDLKSDVIDKCNETAIKYKYSNLEFKLGDINGYEATTPIDMVITLHACDTATDYALYNAIKWNARFILSVPCCQHELNKTIKSNDMIPVMKYGILKERTAALLTDGIRGQLLEAKGYKVQMLEFIDIAHSPKNILIRAVKSHVSKEKKISALIEVENTCKAFNIKPTLYNLLINE